MPYVTVDTEVWIEPDDFIEDMEDDDLITELNRRGYNTDILSKVRGEANVIGSKECPVNLQMLFELKRMNSPAFDKAFSDYCWDNLGKVV